MLGVNLDSAVPPDIVHFNIHRWGVPRAEELFCLPNCLFNYRFLWILIEEPFKHVCARYDARSTDSDRYPPHATPYPNFQNRLQLHSPEREIHVDRLRNSISLLSDAS